MSSAQIAVLGALAGFTIYLGLPVGRMRAPMRASVPAWRAWCTSTGG